MSEAKEVIIVSSDEVAGAASRVFSASCVATPSGPAIWSVTFRRWPGPSSAAGSVSMGSFSRRAARRR